MSGVRQGLTPSAITCRTIRCDAGAGATGGAPARIVGSELRGRSVSDSIGRLSKRCDGRENNSRHGCVARIGERLR